MLRFLQRWIKGPEVKTPWSTRLERRGCDLNLWCDKFRAKALDVSEGGMRLKVPVGAEIRDSVILNYGGGIWVESKVVWTRANEHDVEIGVSFVDVEWRVKRWLKSLKGHNFIANNYAGQKAMAVKSKVQNPAKKKKKPARIGRISLGAKLGEMSN